MPLTSVPAIYDGEHINLLETAPIQGPYHVLVTFIEPTNEDDKLLRENNRFWDSFGAWRDDRPIEETLKDIHEARLSRSEPREL